MANANMIKFYRGLLENLPATGENGALYITTNEGAIYYGTGDGMKRLGDFIQVSSVSDLPTDGANTSALYYCINENILAKYDSTKGWQQINKQPSIEDLKVGLGLGSAAYTDATAYDAAGAADAVREYVGDIPATATATNIVAYIQEKTAGIATDTALEELTGRVATAEGEIDALQADSHTHDNKDELDKIADGDVEKWNNKVSSVAAGDASITIGGTATEPTVAAKISAAEGNALVLAEDGLKVIIPESTKVEASETNGNIKVDGEEVTVYTHPDKHAIADVTGLQDALDGKETAGAAAQALADAQAYADQAEADAVDAAKAYVDEEDIFVTDMNTINALGGIGANVNLNGLTTHEVLKKLLYPYVAPSIGGATASPNGGTYEKGVTKTITQVSISITKKSEPITSVALYNGSTLIEEKTGDAVKNGGTITFTGLSVVVPTDGNQLTVKVTYPDANGASKTESKNTTAMTFVYPYYIGTCAAGTAIDETLVLSLTKKIESKGNKSNSFTVSDGHMVIAYPKAHGVLNSILDPNNFETIGNYTRSEVSVTGLDGTAQAYYVYVSGATTVSGFTVNFKY